MVENQNWTSELSLAYKNLKDLYQFLEWDFSPRLEGVAQQYPLFIPRSLARKIKEEGPNGVLAKEFLPLEIEIEEGQNHSGLEDPIGDKEHLKAPQLIHRYKSRALFTPTILCPVHCRYCFRKNELNAEDEVFQRDFPKTLTYLREHPEISEIIFTGGDPLTLSNSRLRDYMTAFSEISSIKDIRFHTRYPVILPGRIDNAFVELLESFASHFRTITIAIHANHKNEFDSFSREKIRELSKTSIQLLSQTVLLKGINNSRKDLLDLFNEFLSLKVRPYYLHHPDKVKGGMHFYLSLSEGRKLFHSLRQELPGWALPHYIIDIPGGLGKVSAFNPETIAFSGMLLNKDGEAVAIEEPELFT